MTRALNALLITQTIGRDGGPQISFPSSDLLWDGVALLTVSGNGSQLTGLTNSQIAGLGTAATLDVGTGANSIVQLDGSGNLPAVDASALTGLSISQVAGLGTAAVFNVGTGANNVVALDGSGALPAVDGSALTGISAGVQESDLDSIDNAQAIGWSDAQFSRDSGTIDTNAPFRVQTDGTNTDLHVASNGRVAIGTNSTPLAGFQFGDNVRAGWTPGDSYFTMVEKSFAIESHNQNSFEALRLGNTNSSIVGGNTTDIGFWLRSAGSVPRRFARIRGVRESGNVSHATGHVTITTVDTNTESTALTVTNTGILAGSGRAIGWSSGPYLFEGDDNTLEQRNGTSGQAFYTYNTYTDASNYERAEWKWNTNQLVIATVGAGTHSSSTRDIKVAPSGNLILDGLPTSDPTAAGAVWNDSGTLKISAG